MYQRDQWRNARIIPVVDPRYRQLKHFCSYKTLVWNIVIIKPWRVMGDLKDRLNSKVDMHDWSTEFLGVNSVNLKIECRGIYPHSEISWSGNGNEMFKSAKTFPLARHNDWSLWNHERCRVKTLFDYLVLKLEHEMERESYLFRLSFRGKVFSWQRRYPKVLSLWAVEGYGPMELTAK